MVFAEAGDRETAAILDRIYRDEIGHVHYGLTWFRRWKEQAEESDWKVFCSRLEQPLSAARAKGRFSFNEEGRQEAGLDEDFIQ
nr:ferritin-like domain-containing protein [Akkermansiaceae bacterium]